MSQSLVKNLIHLVYSTKHRKPWIPGDIMNDLYAYQAGIFRQWDIENQAEHHRTMTFQDELRALFQRHEIEYDEQYVWV